MFYFDKDAMDAMMAALRDWIKLFFGKDTP